MVFSKFINKAFERSHNDENVSNKQKIVTNKSVNKKGSKNNKLNNNTNNNNNVNSSSNSNISSSDESTTSTILLDNHQADSPKTINSNSTPKLQSNNHNMFVNTSCGPSNNHCANILNDTRYFLDLKMTQHQLGASSIVHPISSSTVPFNQQIQHQLQLKQLESNQHHQNRISLNNTRPGDDYVLNKQNIDNYLLSLPLNTNNINNIQTHYSQQTAQQQQQQPNNNKIHLKCKCKRKNSGNIFNCIECTRNYPINVRRSKDGEETNSFYLDKQNLLAKSKISERLFKEKTKKRENLKQVGEEYEEDDENDDDNLDSYDENESHVVNELQANELKIQLKPSPVPISSRLISLLALNKQISSSTSFVPPPNINLALFQNKK